MKNNNLLVKKMTLKTLSITVKCNDSNMKCTGI